MADIEQAIGAVAARYSDGALALFGRMLNDTSYLVRVTEEAEPLGNGLRLSALLTFSLPAEDREQLKGDDVLPVPLTKLTKGELIDNLDIFDSEGIALPGLPQADTKALVLNAFRGLFTNTFAYGNGQPRELTMDEEAALFTLYRLIWRPRRADMDSIDDVFDRAVQHLAPRSVARVQELRGFCRFFAHNYVVAVEAPVPKGFSFVLRYTRATTTKTRADLPGEARRIRMGLQPFRFEIPLNLAFSCGSYHLRMSAGPNLYVRGHYVLDGVSRELIRQDHVLKMTPRGYLRVRRRGAPPYAHLYSRGLCHATPRDLRAAVTFAEVPPGALGATTLIAMLSAALIVLLVLVAPTRPEFDIAALLLAVPLFAATLAGHSMERVQRSSATTAIGLIFVGLTAFGAAAVYGLPPVEWMVAHEVGLLGGSLVLTRINLVGLALAIVAVLNVGYLLSRLLHATRHYGATLRSKYA